MLLNTNELIFVILWIVLGSILGFLSFTYHHQYSLGESIYRCVLSIFLGLFLALPLCEILLEHEKVSKHLSILLSGVGAIGLPDLFIKYWSRISKGAINIVLDRFGGRRDYVDYERKNRRYSDIDVDDRIQPKIPH